MIRAGTVFISWVITLAFVAIHAVLWNIDSMTVLPERFQICNTEERNTTLADKASLTYLYQSRLDQIGWLKGQCELAHSIIQADQTVFPFLQVPPLLLEEHAEQFHQPVKARIAVLHVWSSEAPLAPPFFQYWLASALANHRIADFLLFVPDEATAARLRRLMPAVSSNSSGLSSSNNIRLHVVGDLPDFYHSRIGPTLDEAKYKVSGRTISRLKPMLGYVFEDYIGEEYYSHWAWADMDLILGNLTKFLSRPLAEGYDVITMSTAEQLRHKNWSTHMCGGNFGIAMAGQLAVFANNNETRNYFRHGNMSELRHQYDEKPFPEMLKRLGIRVAHVFGQVTDQSGRLKNSQFEWSPQGLFKIRPGGGCFEYEAGLVHMMQGKRILRPTKKSRLRPQVVVNPCFGDEKRSAGCIKAFEKTIFPGPFVWESMSGFVLKFPVSPSAPWQLHDGHTDMACECEREE